MNGLLAELSWMVTRCRGRLGSALALSLAFKALNLAVLAPLAAAISRYCLSQWGRASVGNFELVAFFLSPAGLAALLVVGAVLLASLYLEISGLVRLLADRKLHWWQTFKSSTRLLPRLIELGLRQLALCLMVAIPFLAAIGLVYWLAWSGKDLNGLIILKPPAFWWGAVFAGAIAAVYVLLALLLLVRRVYAIPILTFERDVRPRAALRSSIDLSRGAWLRIGGALAAWAITSSLLTAGSLALLHGALLRLISWSGFSTASAVIATGTALVVHAAAVTVLSMLANVTFAAVLLSLYRQVAPSAALSNEEQQAPPGRGRIGWLAALGLLVLVAVGAGVGYLTLRELKLNEPLEITAHRAGAAHGPENTVAALRRAIADRADWAEIDVQLTADNEIVVMHDIDLARVGGGNRRVGEATLKDVQAFDVGASFGPAFAGERIPTFRAMLAAAQGKIRLNVELKPHGKADAPELTRRVVAEIRSAGMVPHCRLCSQSYESLQLARQIEPPLEVGFIAATSVGDLAELNVNFLMVKSNLITRALVDRARLRNIAVHAWTVNDPAQVAPLLDAGIANAITDDPARIRSQLDELRGLSSIERLLLRTRSALVQH